MDLIHSCLKNCDNNCVFTSIVDNSQHTTFHLTKEQENYSVLCPHAFSTKNKQTRLGYPLYQAIKGSNQWIRITWEEAYQLILDNLKKIYKETSNFSPVAWYKGTGNLSIANYSVNEFFYYLNGAIQLNGANCLHSTNELEESDLLSDELIEDASFVCIWGQNTVSNYKHLIPRLLKAKENGTKLLVIDAYFTKTAKFSDYYLQIEPTTDVLLLEDLILLIIEKYGSSLEEIDKFPFNKPLSIPNNYSSQFRMNQLETILQLMLSSPKTIHLVGNGMKKHNTYPKFEIRLNQLLHLLELLGKQSWIMKRKNNLAIFSNQKLKNWNETMISWHDLITLDHKEPLKFLWNSASNPLRQVGNSKMIKQLFYEIDFVVTTEQSMTATAQMSNLILPVTTNLEEWNLIINKKDYSLQLNEPSKQPFGESKSEFTIFNELATYLKRENFYPCHFPSYLDNHDYLEKQWNEEVKNLYGINSLKELKQANGIKKPSIDILQTMKAKLNSNFVLTDINENQLSSKYPFYLLTPHHPNYFNSQLLTLPSIPIEEAVVWMNENTARKYGISDGETITIYNSFTSIEIKVVLTKHIHEYTLMIYNGMTTCDHTFINQLVTSDYYLNKTKNKNAYQPLFFDSFVTIEKCPVY